MKLSESQVNNFRMSLERRIAGILEWYATGAIVCLETMSNIQKDLDWALEEERKKFHFKQLPYILQARSDDGVIVVRQVSKKVH